MKTTQEKAARLKEEIKRLKKEKNALIMAHYYQRDEIQEIADFIGDSLALASQAPAAVAIRPARMAGLATDLST